MKQLEKILVPIDINCAFDKQVEAAIQLARSFGSEICLLYTVPAEGLDEDLKDMIRKSVTDTMEGIKEQFQKSNVQLQEPKISYGNVVETIINTAKEEKANLILLGTRDKKIKAKYKLGVISEQIIQVSDVPVGVIKTESQTLFTKILCPVDFSEPSRRALKNAILLAKAYGSKLHILKVYEPLKSVSVMINADLSEENARRLKKAKYDLNNFVKHFDLSEIDYSVDIKTGNIEENILESIEQHQIDQLIIGTNGRTGLSRFFMGSVAKKVIRELPCSFITVKEIE